MMCKDWGHLKVHQLSTLGGKYSDFGSISDNLDATVSSHVHAVRWFILQLGGCDQLVVDERV